MPLSEEDSDKPFGEPPIMYNYRCKNCNYSSEMNEAHIDVAYGWTKKRTESLYGDVPVLECPNCKKESFCCID